MLIIEKIVNLETNEETLIEREETKEEKDEREKNLANLAAKQAEKEAKLVAQASAVSKLTALGLTEEEIAALRG